MVKLSLTQSKVVNAANEPDCIETDHDHEGEEIINENKQGIVFTRLNRLLCR